MEVPSSWQEAQLVEEPELSRLAAPSSLLNEVSALVRRYVVLTESQADALALWVMHTHTFGAFDTTPYLAITSPTMRSGKTRLFEVLEHVVARPWRQASITPAALYRRIAAQRPTLLLDEVDAQSFTEILRGVVNAGYREGGTITRVVGEEATDFDVFCPKAFAGIGEPLPSTILDRSIPINVTRKSKSEHVERFRSRLVRQETKAVREGMVTFGQLNTEALEEVFPEMPEFLNDRQQDVWEPLFAIAEFVGDGWVERCMSAAKAISAEVQDEPEQLVNLLADIRSVFAEQGDPERIGTFELLLGLTMQEDKSYEGAPIDKPDQLARLLRRFRIGPKSMRLENYKTTHKGYERASFVDAWERYL